MENKKETTVSETHVRSNDFSFTRKDQRKQKQLNKISYVKVKDTFTSVHSSPYTKGVF